MVDYVKPESLDEYQLKRKIPRRPLRRQELNVIKYKLGLKANDPLPVCPAKSKSALVRLEKKKEPWHRDSTHAPCQECGCGRVAGLGTNHYGWGLCYEHEKHYKKEKCQLIAERHLLGLQTRNPRYYMDVMDYVEDELKPIQTVEQSYDLVGNLNKVGSIIDKFINACNDQNLSRKDIDGLKESIDVLIKEVSENQSFEDEDKCKLITTVENIYTRVSCPLTELAAGGKLIPMTDKTRWTLLSNTTPKMAMSVKYIHDMLKEKWITPENFLRWTQLLWKGYMKVFGEKTYKDDDGTEKMIVASIADWMKEAKEMVKRGEA